MLIRSCSFVLRLFALYQYGQQTIQGQQTSCIQCFDSWSPWSLPHLTIDIASFVSWHTSNVDDACSSWYPDALEVRPPCHVQGLIQREEGDSGDVVLLFTTEDFFFFLIAEQVGPQIHIQLLKSVL